MNEELKPCPFCGGDEIHQYVDPDDISYTWEGWTILTECTCGAQMSGRAQTEKQAYNVSAKNWNTRYEPTCKMPMCFDDGEGEDLPAYYRPYKCDACGQYHDHYKGDDYEYCPHCGAKAAE